MKLAPALLEEWLREYYFNTEIDICSSGVQNFSLAELRNVLDITEQELDGVVFDDSPIYGHPRLRQAIADQWGNGDPQHVMATHGSSEVIFLVINALLRPGDEVVALDPCYFSYRNLAESKGCKLKLWRLRFEQKFALDVDELKKLITPRTRMVMVNFPHNPTGASVTAEQQRELIRVTARVGAYLVWDTALADLTHDGPPLPDPHLLYERAISIGTLSKAYGLAGLRVGWCLAAPELIEQFVHLRNYTTLYLSPLVEVIATRAVEKADDILRIRLPQARANLETLDRWIGEHAELIEWVRPRGGVTAFPRLRYVLNVETFCRRLTEERGVLLVPGNCFSYEDHVRLGFGGPTAEFQEALNRLSDMLRTESCSHALQQTSSSLAQKVHS
jgi:capreomycidine synthase